MESLALVVPVYKNFVGFTQLMHSVDTTVLPIVIDNYRENVGVSKAWNVGINRAVYAGCQYIMVCNDDIVLETNTIMKMLDTLENTDIDLVTAINRRDFPEPGTGSEDDVDYSCFMVRSTFFDTFGTFDEKFSPAYFEDNDMAYRIKLLGGTQRKLLNAPMFHEGSVTQNWDGQQVVTSPMFEANRAYYIGKWGGTPGQEQYSTPFNGLTGKTPKEW